MIKSFHFISIYGLSKFHFDDIANNMVTSRGAPEIVASQYPSSTDVELVTKYTGTVWCVNAITTFLLQ